MTPTEKLLAEQEKVVAERGYYIRPVRMANLMKAASRMSCRCASTSCSLPRTVKVARILMSTSLHRVLDEPAATVPVASI